MLENPYYTSDPYDDAIPTGRISIFHPGETEPFFMFDIDEKENIDVLKTQFDDETSDVWVEAIVGECYWEGDKLRLHIDDDVIDVECIFQGNYGYSNYRVLPKQEEEIATIKVDAMKVFDQKRKAFFDEWKGRHVELFNSLFTWFDRAEDFYFEGEAGDWTYDSCGDCDCPVGWDKIASGVDLWRKDGVLGLTIQTVDEDGNGDTCAEWDENSIKEEYGPDFLHDYFAHITGHKYFRGLVEYHCHVARTGEDPLGEWMRAYTYEDNLRAARSNLEYLKM